MEESSNGGSPGMVRSAAGCCVSQPSSRGNPRDKRPVRKLLCCCGPAWNAGLVDYITGSVPGTSMDRAVLEVMYKWQDAFQSN